MAHSHVLLLFPTSGLSFPLVPEENFRKKQVRDFTRKRKQPVRMKAMIAADSAFQRVLWFLFSAVRSHFHENLTIGIEEKKTCLCLGPMWDWGYKWNFSEHAVRSTGLAHWLVVTVLPSAQCHLTSPFILISLSPHVFSPSYD